MTLASQCCTGLVVPLWDASCTYTGPGLLCLQQVACLGLHLAPTLLRSQIVLCDPTYDTQCLCGGAMRNAALSCGMRAGGERLLDAI